MFTEIVNKQKFVMEMSYSELMSYLELNQPASLGRWGKEMVIIELICLRHIQSLSLL